MTSDSLEALMNRRPRKITRDPSTATVARIDEEGTWVSVQGADPRQPIGPCRGGARLVDGDLFPADPIITVGTNVLLVWTNDGPWVAAVEQL